MNKFDFIKIKSEGDPMRKWISIAVNQVLSELMECPTCASKNITKYEGGRFLSFFRCDDCYCLWEIDMEKVKQEAQARVEKEQKIDLDSFL
jgi:transposase-like protein